MKNDNPLSQKEFWEIYKKVPRLTVEIVIRKNKTILLTLRNIEPCKGMWHLPGGTVRFGERLIDAVARIAARELSIMVSATKILGYIEYPSHFDNGLDSPVGIAFEVTGYKGPIKPNAEASKYDWFKELPDSMHSEQKDFIKQNELI